MIFRYSGGEEIAKNYKSHFCDNLVPARPENFWSRGVNDGQIEEKVKITVFNFKK